MVETYLLNHPWIPTLAFVLLFSGDKYLTIWGARLWAARVQSTSLGDYELTPQLQDDIAGQRLVTTLFLRWMVIGVAILLVSAFILTRFDQSWAASVYGLIIGYQMVSYPFVYFVHIRKIRHYTRSGEPQATFNEGRWDLAYRRSFIRLGTWALYLLVAAVLIRSFILLGGVLDLGATAVFHGILARRFRRQESDADFSVQD